MKKFSQHIYEDYLYDEKILNNPNVCKTFYNNNIFCYVNVLIRSGDNKEWHCFGPYNHKAAEKLMIEYLKNGNCCWIEESNKKK